MELLIKLRYKNQHRYEVKCSVYEREIKKSNKVFFIIQNYSTSCYIISAFLRILIKNGANKTSNSCETNCIILVFSYYYGVTLSV